MASDWHIRVLPQMQHPPFRKFCAIARRIERGGIVRELNAEGDTPAEARAAIIERLKKMGLMDIGAD